jgi:hypothetical protein
MPSRPHLKRDKRQHPYWRDNGLLGKTFLDRQAEGILVIGRDVWSRQEIVDNLHCGNFVAAQNLTKIARKLQVESLDQLVTRFTLEDLFRENGCGVTTIYVLLCAQEARQKDPLKWVDRAPDDLVTLNTEKLRARKRQEDARKEARAKKRATRAAANPSQGA